MVGLEFGRHLGAPRALTPLPLSPLVPRYALLVSAQQVLGLRYAGQALLTGGSQLGLLDGVFLSAAGRRRQHVSRDLLNRLKARNPSSAALFQLLGDYHEADRTALRRVLLYQLAALLHAHPRGTDPSVAVSLGIDPAEAPALVRGVAALPRLDVTQRLCAEGAYDAWESRRVREAARCLAALPVQALDEPLLARFADQVEARVRRVDTCLATAREHERCGRREEAGKAFHRAVRIAADCPHALRGLVHAHRPAPGTEGTLRARLDGAVVRLDQAREHGEAGERALLLRLLRRPGRPPAITALTATALPATDDSPPLGGEVRYALLSRHNGVVDRSPLVSAALLVTPEVSDLAVHDGAGRLHASWTRPAGAHEVRVELSGPGGFLRTRRCGRADTWSEDELPAGRYRLRVAALYRDAAGRDRAAAGRAVRAAVHPWPAPVTTLTARAADDAVRLEWIGGRGAEVRLVEWPGAAPAPGTELSDPAAWPPALDWPRPAPGDAPADVRAPGRGDEGTAHALLVPPPGTARRVGVLTVLGERALAGPTLLVQTAPRVAGVRVERPHPDRARLLWDWPSGAGRITVVVQQDGEPDTEHPVTRSTYFRSGLTVPVTPARARFLLRCSPATPHAVLSPDPGTRAELPADRAVAYRLLPRPRRPLRRPPLTVRVQVSGAGEADGAPLPEFVLVGRYGTHGAPARPRDPEDGVTLLRLSGEELQRTGTVERAVDTPRGSAPCALRGFLLGASAGVRLEEPSPTTLVVR